MNTSRAVLDACRYLKTRLNDIIFLETFFKILAAKQLSIIAIIDGERIKLKMKELSEVELIDMLDYYQSVDFWVEVCPESAVYLSLLEIKIINEGPYDSEIYQVGVMELIEIGLKAETEPCLAIDEELDKFERLGTYDYEYLIGGVSFLNDITFELTDRSLIDYATYCAQGKTRRQVLHTLIGFGGSIEGYSAVYYCLENNQYVLILQNRLFNFDQNDFYRYLFSRKESFEFKIKLLFMISKSSPWVV